MIRAEDVLRALERLPWRDRDEIVGAAPLLVLAPHPDDESLGCGGLIAESCARGRDVHVAILTDGTGSHPSSPSYPAPRLRALRQREALAAVEALGLDATRVSFMELKDTQAPRSGPAFSRAVERLIALARRTGAGAICATWRHDPHCDHEAAHLIAEAAAAATGARLVSYPVWGWTLPGNHELPEEVLSGARLDIAAHLPAKRRAVAAHASQHSGLIDDDPRGFRLPPALLSVFDRPFEVFLTGP